MASTAEQLYLSNGQNPRFTAMCSKLCTLAAMVASKNPSQHIPMLAKRYRPRNSTEGSASQGILASSNNNSLPSSSAAEHSLTNALDYSRRTTAVGQVLNPEPLAHQEATWFESEPSLGLGLIDQDNRGVEGNSTTQAYPPRQTMMSTPVPGDAEDLGISPSTIDRLWTSTLTDSLDFPYMTQSSDTLNPSPVNSYSGLDMSQHHGIPSANQAYHQHALGPTAIEHSDTSNNINQPLDTQQLLSPAASNDPATMKYTMPEAHYLFGVPLLSDIGHELDMLYGEGPTEDTLN